MSGGWAHGGPVGGAAWWEAQRAVSHNIAEPWLPTDPVHIDWDTKGGRLIGEEEGDYVRVGQGIVAPHAGLYLVTVDWLVTPSNVTLPWTWHVSWYSWPEGALYPFNPGGMTGRESAGTDDVSLLLTWWWWVTQPSSDPWVPQMILRWDTPSPPPDPWYVGVQQCQVVAWRQGVPVP